MSEERLMTVDEFNVQVNKWALRVAQRSRQKLRSETHGSGRLANWLSRFVDRDRQRQAAYKVKFQFERYGVFRAYGAGRGYVVMNGQIVRGFRERPEKGSKKSKKSLWYSDRRDGGDGGVRRSKLDWIDAHVEGSIGQLADLCQEYYGDKAAEQILAHLDRMKIVKRP
ncbi:MAG: hypothetical protein IJ901_10610 [Bacteroidaceae bacterium]|nr:hypothetical protein [Bacteroidaceae bacterium]